MLATHHFNAYIDHYGHLYQKDKKHPGQYISEGISFLMKYGKLLKLGQEKKENSPDKKDTIEEIVTAS